MFRKVFQESLKRFWLKNLKILNTISIKRTVIDNYPVKISYQLKPYAASLTPVIYSLKDWGLNHRKIVSDRTSAIWP
jgi:DNA-binding HxlR family transcriptional regulator